MAAGLTIEQMEFLVGKGLSAEELLTFAKMGDKSKSKGAERTARWRARKHGNVTSDVTCDASPPPIEDHTPPVSSDEETSPNPKVTKLTPPRPDGVTDQTWRDFLQSRKAQKATVNATVIAGITREAAKVGWPLEAALAESVTRGWRGFKADWVQDAPAKSSGEGGFLGHLMAKQAGGT